MLPVLDIPQTGWDQLSKNIWTEHSDLVYFAGYTKQIRHRLANDDLNDLQI